MAFICKMLSGCQLDTAGLCTMIGFEMEEQIISWLCQLCSETWNQQTVFIVNWVESNIYKIITSVDWDGPKPCYSELSKFNEAIICKTRIDLVYSIPPKLTLHIISKCKANGTSLVGEFKHNFKSRNKFTKPWGCMTLLTWRENGTIANILFSFNKIYSKASITVMCYVMYLLCVVLKLTIIIS